MKIKCKKCNYFLDKREVQCPICRELNMDCILEDMFGHEITLREYMNEDSNTDTGKELSEAGNVR